MKKAAEFIFVFLLFISFREERNEKSFTSLMESFDKELRNLNLPEFSYDYKENFNRIPQLSQLDDQQKFFIAIQQKLSRFKRKKLSTRYQVYFDHMQYEINLNLERIALEKKFRTEGTLVPTGGLSELHKDWYQYYIHFFTGVHITPEELYQFGEKEVSRVQHEIRLLRNKMGYANDSAGFYRYLQSDEFFMDDKQEIISRYERIKQTAYANIYKLFTDTSIANIAFMTWPDAGKFTPPGYYSPEAENAYGVSVFHFNFFGGKHNRRVMEWLFMHEAVPGHHYQWCMKTKLNQPAFMQQFFYPGNFEGWGAYVEYLGKNIGLYSDDASYLGKWEWDLVRSTRILIDVGIHHKGWTKEEAVECWKKNIPGQDEIAEREVVRCTNWPGQALSYKVGAERIMAMKQRIQQKKGQAFSLQQFHQAYLSFGATPLAVIEQNIENYLD